MRGQAHRLIGVVGAWDIPWWRHLHAQQPALEPTILGPCQMLDDAGDRQIRRWQQAGRGLPPLKVDERGRCDRSVLIEALGERCALVPGLEIRMRHINAGHQHILAGCRPPPPGSAKSLPDRPADCRRGLIFRTQEETRSPRSSSSGRRRQRGRRLGAPGLDDPPDADDGCDDRPGKHDLVAGDQRSNQRHRCARQHHPLACVPQRRGCSCGRPVDHRARALNTTTLAAPNHHRSHPHETTRRRHFPDVVTRDVPLRRTTSSKRAEQTLVDHPIDTRRQRIGCQATEHERSPTAPSFSTPHHPRLDVTDGTEVLSSRDLYEPPARPDRTAQTIVGVVLVLVAAVLIGGSLRWALAGDSLSEAAGQR